MVERRRRGEELEAAILAAAWDELVDVGYGRLTMGSVAARARTSEPVLYRRWPNKDQLVLAALGRRRAAHQVEAVDTGTLRGDLLAELAAVGEAFAGFYAIAAAASFGGLLADTGRAPTQVREELMGGWVSPAGRAVYRRAHERGEIDLDAVPDVVLDMPFDLVRHDLLMALAPPSPARVAAIVDELFLPLVTPRRAPPGRRPGR